ncbi:MAG: general secretion pathway protein GspK [Spirochaetota bacterium]
MEWFAHIINRIKANYEHRRRRLETDGVLGYAAGHSGYVLLIVMVICTMLISVSSDFLLNAQININYMKRFRDEAIAQSVAEAGLTLGRIILQADDRGVMLPGLSGANTDKSIDSYKDIWAIDFPEVDLGSGTVKVIIRDEQSKINISAVSTQYVERSPFYSILDRFFINMGFPSDYSEAVLDWVDKDDTKTGNGAETYDYYSTLPVPYNAANAPFDSIDQLLLVKHFTPEVYYGFGGGNALEEAENESLVDSNTMIESVDMMEIMSQATGEDTGDTTDDEEEDDLEIEIGTERSRALDEYLRAHGNSDVFNAHINKININTAPYRVLISLTDDMTDDAVKSLIRHRIDSPFKNVEEASEYITDELVRKNTLTTHSDLFRITSIGYVHGNYVTIEAVYDRSTKEFYYYSVR